MQGAYDHQVVLQLHGHLQSVRGQRLLCNHPRTTDAALCLACCSSQGFDDDLFADQGLEVGVEEHQLAASARQARCKSFKSFLCTSKCPTDTAVQLIF